MDQNLTKNEIIKLILNNDGKDGSADFYEVPFNGVMTLDWLVNLEILV